MEKLIESTDYALAQKWAIEIAGDPNQAQMIIPEVGFIKAVRNSNSVSLTRKDEKLFGLGLGINPPIDPDWERYMVERKVETSDLTDSTPLLELDIYSIETEQFKGTLVNFDVY